jgi:hypothetical protein
MVSAADRVTDERVTCLRIFADANGETHMEDVDIAFQPRKLFKDNPPLRLSDNFPASWFNICHVPAGMCEVDWHNPPQRLLVLWLTGEVEFETSDGSPPTPRRERGAGGGHHRQGTYFPSSAGGSTGGARGFRVVLKSKRDRVRSIAPSPPLWTRAPFVRQNPTFRDGHHNGSRLRADARGRDDGVREKLAGGRGMIEVARVRITEAGRKALAEMTR